MELTDIKGVGKKTAEKLVEAGFTTVDDLKKASVEDLVAVEGIGEKLAHKIKEEVERLVEEPVEEVELEDAVVEEEEIEEEIEEEKKERVKVIPSLTEEEKRLLNVRKAQKSRKPYFRRHDAHKKKRLDDNWRRPRGRHSKLRKKIKGKGAVVCIGYASPSLVRGYHPSGFIEKLVHTPKEIENLDPSKHAIRIGRTVGLKKRLEIEAVAEEKGFRVLNPAKVG
jgi:large subunit ribosomal protein L32e